MSVRAIRVTPTLFKSYQAGIPTTGLKLERNYIHDCVDAQGFPFLKDGDISNVTIADNLAVRMSSDNQVTGMFVDDNSSGLTIIDNTYQDTSGSVVQSEGAASNPTDERSTTTCSTPSTCPPGSTC